MIDRETQKRLEELTELFLAENAKLNLSALRTREQCWVGNVLDSLSCIDIYETLFVVKKRRFILDIGTGGGFPLLPLAIALPDVQFVGIDAVKKKIDAIERIKQKLNIQNVTLLVGRSEEFAHKTELRGQFDVITARAVAPLSTLLEYSMPFASVGGKAVFWKSMHIADELRESVTAQRELRTALKTTHEYELPAGFGKRQLLIFEKLHATDVRYPRRTGIPRQKPL